MRTLADTFEIQKLDNKSIKACISAIRADLTYTCPVEGIELSPGQIPSLDLSYGLPSVDGLLSVLRQCRKLKSPSLGLFVHAQCCNHGLESHPSIGNHLVPMFVDCGHLGLAHQVFLRSFRWNEYSWTALIQGFSKSGDVKDALSLFAVMLSDGIDPSAHSYVAVLKCCVELPYIQEGFVAHIGIIEHGADRELHVSNMLLFMYAKYGCTAELHKIFYSMSYRDMFSWSALMVGMIECGLHEEALQTFHQMQNEGVQQDGVIYIHCLNACSDMKLINQGREMHLKLIECGLLNDLSIGNTLIDMYMKCGSVIEAQEVFDRLPFLDVVSWTALMIGYADNGLNKEVLRYLDHMNRKCIAPNELTYTCSLHACAMTGNIGKGFELHNDIVKKGFDIEIPVGDYVVKLYSKCGFLFDAENVFERLMQKDVSTWNSLLTGYSEHGFADETFGQFQKMQIQGISPDIVSWNSLIMSFAEQRSMLSTVNLLLQMQEQGLLPNSMTFATILRSCSDAAALMHGRRVHAQICKSDIIDTVDTNMMTDLFNMYGRCGNMYDANLVFDEFGVRDLISWNALITGYAHQGDIDTVFLLFRRMQDSAQPNSTTFLNVLNACNHMGHLQEAYQYLELMRDGYDLIPSIRHFNCILDLHGRTSNLHNMGVVLEHMPYQPDLPVWNSVANAIATLSASNF